MSNLMGYSYSTDNVVCSGKQLGQAVPNHSRAALKEVSLRWLLDLLLTVSLPAYQKQYHAPRSLRDVHAQT